MNRSPVVRIGGGGSLFPWYAGYLKYMTEHFDTGNVTFVGESTGAFMAVCVVCGVDLDEAIEAAIKIHVDNDVDVLLYVWGNLVRSWIDALLPDDAADTCNGRVKIAATQMPWFRRRYITHFSSKADVVEAAMASAHVPFVMDGKFATKYNNRWYIDGCIGFDMQNIKNQICISYTDDPRMNNAELSMIKIIDPETAQCIKNWGYTYARDLDASGSFDAVLGQIRLKK